MSDGAPRHPPPRTLSREAIARVDLVRPARRRARACPSTCATRCGAWSRRSCRTADTSAGLVVAGMGGSAIGGALARAALGDHATRPIFVTRAYGLPPWTTPDTMVLCASYSGDTEETLACYESAGALGARRTVVTTGGRLAEMARADGVPVIPLPGGFQPRAAVAYMTVAALEVAALCGAGPRLDVGDRRRRLAHRAARRRVGPGRARGLAGQGGRARPARHDAGDRRRRADDADRLPLEDADQRERQAAGVLRTNCPSSTTTRSPAGRAPRTSAASRRCSSTTPTRTRA